MNKRKPDDEFENIHLSYFTADGKETVIYCPESRDAVATLTPLRKELGEAPRHETSPEAIEPLPKKPLEQADAISDIQPDGQDAEPELKEQHFTYQRPGSWFEVGATDLNLRKYLETKVDIFRL